MSKINSASIKTKKTALYVLLIYIACQLSSFILLIVPPLKDYLFDQIDAKTMDDKAYILSAYWTTASFAVALVLILILIIRDKKFWNVFSGKSANVPEAIGWGILGFIMIYVGQIIGVYIETLFGIDPGSENTADIGAMMKSAPIMILAVAIIGPILEELVFRRVIFGSLIQKYNFWISAIVSGVVFAAVHLEFEHILLYTICGLIFAFLYYKTKSIITSIVAHIMLNSTVSLIQWYYDDIMEFLEKYQQMFIHFFNY